MKKSPIVEITVIWIIIVMLIFIGIYLVDKNEESVEAPVKTVQRINVVNNITPVWSLPDFRLRLLSAMRTVPADERDEYIARHWPSLSRDLVIWLKERGTLAQDAKVTDIHYLFGSAEAEAEDHSGKIHKGYFEDELVAKITVEGDPSPLLVAVRCLNGLFKVIGSLAPVVTETFSGTLSIGRGQGLCHHVDYRTAIRLADIFNLPLYKGRRMVESKRITPEEALALEDMTDHIQVTVLIHPGDVLNLDNMTYNGKQANE